MRSCFHFSWEKDCSSTENGIIKPIKLVIKSVSLKVFPSHLGSYVDNMQPENVCKVFLPGPCGGGCLLQRNSNWRCLTSLSEYCSWNQAQLWLRQNIRTVTNFTSCVTNVSNLFSLNFLLWAMLVQYMLSLDELMYGSFLLIQKFIFCAFPSHLGGAHCG